MRRNQIVLFCMLVALLSSGCTNQARQSRNLVIRVSGADKDAAEPAMAAASDGSVYLAWVDHDANGAADVMLAAFDASGKSRGPASRINPTAGEAKAWRGDPPTVAVGPDGTVYVGWTARASGQWDGTDLVLSASRDNGASFGSPVKVNDDQKAGAHGMHSLAIASDGSVVMSWLDERNRPAAASPKKKDHKKDHKHAAEPNRELFVATSNDGGKTFSANQLLAREVCACCKTSLAIAPDRRIYVSWRQVLPGNLRHIAVASSTDLGKTFSPPVIVSDDRWTIAGCPVSGPSISVSVDGKLQILWYSAGDAGPTGIYRAESQDAGKSFTPRQLIAEGQVQGTPVLLPHMNGAVAIWQKDQGSGAHVMTAYIDDKAPTTSRVSIVGASELPAASLVRDQIRLAYVQQAGNDSRSVWLLNTSASNTR